MTDISLKYSEFKSNFMHLDYHYEDVETIDATIEILQILDKKNTRKAKKILELANSFLASVSNIELEESIQALIEKRNNKNND